MRLVLFCVLAGFMSMSFDMAQTAEGLTLVNCPAPGFTAINNGCTGPCEITFANQSINASSYEWDFGDGNCSYVENPRHTYQSAGTYTVKLTAMMDGCTVPYIGTVDIVAF